MSKRRLIRSATEFKRFCIRRSTQLDEETRVPSFKASMVKWLISQGAYVRWSESKERDDPSFRTRSRKFRKLKRKAQKLYNEKGLTRYAIWFALTRPDLRKGP